MDCKKIGIFDSGIGGISILNKLLQTDTQEFLYAADTAYLPYGQQTPETLLQRGKIIAHLFLQQKISTVVVACHTSSATTLAKLIKEFPDITFIDMLLPTIYAATAATKNSKVGVIATEATIASQTHKKLFKEHAPHITLFEQATPQLVPLLEKQANKEEITTTLCKYLDFIKSNKIDTLILGCTHYAFLKQHIESIIPHVALICADDLVKTTNNKNKKNVKFFVSGNKNEFKDKIEKFLNNKVDYSVVSF